MHTHINKHMYMYKKTNTHAPPQLSFAAMHSVEGSGGGPLIAEEHIVFGLIASTPVQTTVKDMSTDKKEYSVVDILALAKEVKAYGCLFACLFVCLFL